MPIDLSLEADGMEAANKIIREFAKLGSIISGVTLRDIDRIEDDVSNVTILREYLPEWGRDFVSPDADMVADIVSAFERVLLEYRERVYSSKKPVSINNWASKAWIAAMKAYMAAVTDRIDSQVTAGGGKPVPLEYEYEVWKENKYGYTTIGKATGQLLDNLNPDGTAKRNIRLTRGKK